MTSHATQRNQPRVWLITGCSSGLGREIATHALERGDRVAVTARDPNAVADLVHEYEDSALALRLDVADQSTVAGAVRSCEDAFGRIDVLVNNAGYGYLAAIEEGQDGDVRDLFDVNVFGVISMIKAVLPGMRARRSGHIVNVSSFGGLAAFAATGYYHAVKFAVEGLSESLAAEVAPLGIAVTVVEPGGLRTEWAGSSMRQSPVEIDDYAATAGRRRETTLAVSGRQPGDPRRAAAAIGSIVERDSPPLRLLLGSDALNGVRSRLTTLAAGFDADAELTKSVDFDSARSD